MKKSMVIYKKIFNNLLTYTRVYDILFKEFRNTKNQIVYLN